mmetsp:Transcript_24493/g.61606  ORF Transcript_24493/g.61606 Transcript_24493/m.61606 type:complete len:204 (+) Transcript_24493:760-1371(+)
MLYAQGMYIPRVPLWIVRKPVGSNSRTAERNTRVSGSENGFGPGLVSADISASEGSHLSSQFRLRSTEFWVFTRKQYSPVSTRARDSGFPFTTIRISVESRSLEIAADVARPCAWVFCSSEETGAELRAAKGDSPQTVWRKCSPDSAEISSRACSPKRRKKRSVGVASVFLIDTTSIAGPSASFRLSTLNHPLQREASASTCS